VCLPYNSDIIQCNYEKNLEDNADPMQALRHTKGYVTERTANGRGSYLAQRKKRLHLFSQSNWADRLGIHRQLYNIYNSQDRS
jgi:hypothetical protein